MSWSISFIGTPENVIKALDKQSDNLSGQSKEEFDGALPHLKALVEKNFGNPNASVIKLEANGHGVKNGEEKTSEQCQVKLEILWGALV